MGIKPRFTEEDFKRELNGKLGNIELSIQIRLQNLGEKCLIEMRTNKGYTDQTGNLTASMGYVVVMKGKVVTTAGFDGGPEKGKTKGKDFIDTFKDKNANGYALYVVAGMEYASYVEATGRNVLTSAELLADKEMPILISKLKSDIGKMQ